MQGSAVDTVTIPSLINSLRVAIEASSPSDGRGRDIAAWTILGALADDMVLVQKAMPGATADFDPTGVEAAIKEFRGKAKVIPREQRIRVLATLHKSLSEESQGRAVAR